MPSSGKRIALGFGVAHEHEGYRPGPDLHDDRAVIDVVVVAFGGSKHVNGDCALLHELQDRARVYQPEPFTLHGGHQVAVGLDGEKPVGQFLGANRKEGWYVLHDIPAVGFNVDLVLIAPQGVFVIETKTYSKPLRGEATAQFDGKRLLVNGFEPERNPITQAREIRDWVDNLLQETTAKRYPVKGVVVLPGWYVSGHQDRSDIWVLNNKALLQFIERGRCVVKDEDVAPWRIRGSATMSFTRLAVPTGAFGGPATRAGDAQPLGRRFWHATHPVLLPANGLNTCQRSRLRFHLRADCRQGAGASWRIMVGKGFPGNTGLTRNFCRSHAIIPQALLVGPELPVAPLTTRGCRL